MGFHHEPFDGVGTELQVIVDSISTENTEVFTMFSLLQVDRPESEVNLIGCWGIV